MLSMLSNWKALTVKPKKRTHTSITGKSMFGTDAEYYLAFTLPAARWTCSDGREVLVNGFDEPIWQRQGTGDATPADPHERVRGVVTIERIYGDARRHYEKRAVAKTWLEDFRAGLRITLYPESREQVGSADAHGVSGGGGSVQVDRRRWA
jgi:hypothetical protein